MEVKKLKRTRVGGLRMPSELPLGKYMNLKPHQAGGLMRTCTPPTLRMREIRGLHSSASEIILSRV